MLKPSEVRVTLEMDVPADVDGSHALDELITSLRAVEAGFNGVAGPITAHLSPYQRWVGNDLVQVNRARALMVVDLG